MSHQTKDPSVQATDRKHTSGASQTAAASFEKTACDVAAAPSQKAAATVPRDISKDGKNTKPRPASNTESKLNTVELRIPSFNFIDQQFLDGVSEQLRQACSRMNGIDVTLYKSMVSVLNGQQPKDHFELMIMNQMSGINDLAMKYIGFLAKADTYIEIDTLERTLNKLTRTFTIQMDALQRYRSGGERNVTVQNVSVGEGGQAIVGNVTQNGRHGGEVKTAAPAAIPDARTEPMPVIEPSERPVAVPVKRRARR
jgi:hypothetical protein